jgi:hypothetical protein
MLLFVIGILLFLDIKVILQYLYEVFQFAYAGYGKLVFPSTSFWGIPKFAFTSNYDDKNIYIDEKQKDNFIDNLENFLQQQKNKFELFVEKMQCNQNIEDTLYDLKKTKEILKEANNKLESRWKKNILWMDTPNGNIVMFYDIYKNGFSYYADSQTISYKILNAVAMKYVERFLCRDFFVDEYITESPSKLLKLWKEEDEKEKETKNEKIKCLIGKNVNTNIFLGSKEKSNLTHKHVHETEKRKNKFIYLGKMGNFSFLQKNDAKKNVIIKPILYRDFKKNYLKENECEIMEQKGQEYQYSGEQLHIPTLQTFSGI